MFLICDKCNSQCDCKMDKNTGDVICSNCGEILEKVTPFAKKAMKANKDFLQRNKKSFAFHCSKCNRSMQAVLNKEDKAVCSECKTPMDQVSAFMLQTMKNLSVYDNED